MNKSLRIGTLVGGQDAVRVIPQIMQHGFESFNLTFWQTTGDLDLAETAKRVREIVDEQGIVISAVSVFGNPLTGAGDNADTLASWERVIDHAQLFGADIVSGFTGRLTDQPINESIHRFKEVFGELARRAADRGVRIAFENCDMGGTWQTGDWNIAHNPTAWEMMFDAVPDENVGLSGALPSNVQPDRSYSTATQMGSQSLPRTWQRCHDCLGYCQKIWRAWPT